MARREHKRKEGEATAARRSRHASLPVVASHVEEATQCVVFVTPNKTLLLFKRFIYDSGSWSIAPSRGGLSYFTK